MPRYQRIDVASGAADDFGRAVLEGLAGEPKSLPCRFFYDEVGSRLFEAICVTEEYYPTRSEREILAARARDLATRFPDHTLVELGSGNAEKTTVLLAARRAARYVPIDIDPAVLDRAGRRLVGTLPALEVLAIAAEYQAGLDRAAAEVPGPKLVLWLGGNAGNFTRAGAADFLAGVREHLGPGDALLLGADLRKDTRVLESAYDDPTGVTAAFNKNLLGRINRELGGDFDVRAYRHVAEYDELGGVLRMFLASAVAQTARVSALGLELGFEAGERIHTEDSTKYSREELEQLGRASGFSLEEHWLDARGLYSVSLLGPA